MLCNIATEDDDAEGTKPVPNVNRPKIPNKINKFMVHTSSSSKDFESIENAIMSLNSILGKQLDKYEGSERVKIGAIMKTKNTDLLQKIKDHNPEIYNQVHSKLEKFND